MKIFTYLMFTVAFLSACVSRSTSQAEYESLVTNFLNSNNNSQITYREFEVTDVTVADSIQLLNEQFKRIFQKEIGLNPKEYIQIQRFNRLLNILQNDNNYTLDDIAFDCGYYDKSHLIKEFKSLSDYSPTEFRQHCDPYSTSKSLFQSFFINIQ